MKKMRLVFWLISWSFTLSPLTSFSAHRSAVEKSKPESRWIQKADSRDINAEKRDEETVKKEEKSYLPFVAETSQKKNIRTLAQPEKAAPGFLKKSGILKKTGIGDKGMSPALAFLCGFFLGWIGVLIVYLATDEDKTLTKKALWGAITAIIVSLVLTFVITVVYFLIFGIFFWGFL